MKVKALIASIACILIVGVIAILLYCFWPAIKGTVDNSKYYTAEELQEAYDKGYDDGCKTEIELTGQVEYYKQLVDEYYIQVNTLNDEISTLNDSIRQKDEQISSLTNTKNSLESSIEGLNGTIKENEQTIKDNESEIESLNGQIQGLQKQIRDKETEEGEKDKEIERLGQQIETLNGRITSLERLNEQLEQTNQANLSTITTLNIQIKSLNEQIVELSKQTQGNTGLVSSLNAQIAQMQKSIEYYENYIKQLESDDQVVATFIFNGSVYSIQIFQKNSKVLFSTPESTDYIIFNYWETESGEKVEDTNSYTISQNTKFIANITYKYDVKFMVDSQQYKETQFVEKEQFANLPDNPSKEGYEFDGWTINGIDVIDVSSYKITSNTIFVAKFTQLFDVTFLYESETKSTQKVRSGGYAQDVEVESTAYKIFNGWKLNGVIVDVETQQIVGNVTFIADITYKYDVKFKLDDETEDFYDSQIVEQGKYATLPASPRKDNFAFEGWTINGEDIVDVNSYTINSSTTFIAKFRQFDRNGTYLCNYSYSTSPYSSRNVKIYIYVKDGIPYLATCEGKNVNLVYDEEQGGYAMESDIYSHTRFLIIFYDSDDIHLSLKHIDSYTIGWCTASKISSDVAPAE